MTQSAFSNRVRAKSLQLCSTLCDSMDCSLLGSSVRGILQARILEWVATFFIFKTSLKHIFGGGAATLGLWDLSSPTRDETQGYCSKSIES